MMYFMHAIKKKKNNMIYETENLILIPFKVFYI
jgi:hypothetical protein